MIKHLVDLVIKLLLVRADDTVKLFDIFLMNQGAHDKMRTIFIVIL